MTNFQRERLACAWFFACIGLSYGIFTSRMPALKQLTQANDSMIGFLLLAYGGASFCGLLASRPLVAKFGPKLITALTSLCSTIFLGIGFLAPAYWVLLIFCVFCGLCTGLCDVAMNAQGMSIERRYSVLCLSSLHASFSFGGVLGSLAGSLFAALELSPFLNLLITCGLWFLLWPLAFRNLGNAPAEKRQKAEKKRLPFFIYFCGFMAMLCYVSEGSVGEWGSVLLHSVKNAPQDQAALVFGSFCVAMVIGRMFGDKLRKKLGDFKIVFFGGLIATIAMSVVLLASWPPICLAAYMAMGIGFAPIVPILYSRAGSLPGYPLSSVSSTISVLAYTGMLFFPPFLGMLGQRIGLGNALWTIVGTCALVCIGSLILFRKSGANNA